MGRLDGREGIPMSAYWKREINIWTFLCIAKEGRKRRGDDYGRKRKERHMKGRIVRSRFA